MSLNSGGNFSDVINEAYETASLTIGTTQVEAKTGGSALENRQELIIFNNSQNDIFYGPTGVTTSTGIPLEPNGTLDLPFGPDISVYLIAGSAGNNVIVQEMA